MIRAAVRYVSYEPAIGPLRPPKLGLYPDWLISGGESGGGARPMDPQWARDIIADCRRYDVVPFHKQWGTYTNNPLVAEDGVNINEAIMARAVDWSTASSCGNFRSRGRLTGKQPKGRRRTRRDHGQCRTGHDSPHCVNLLRNCFFLASLTYKPGMSVVGRRLVDGGGLMVDRAQCCGRVSSARAAARRQADSQYEQLNCCLSLQS
jgi:hypothetical protein